MYLVLPQRSAWRRGQGVVEPEFGSAQERDQAQGARRLSLTHITIGTVRRTV